MDEMPLPVRMMSSYLGFVGLVLGNESGALDALVSGAPSISGELAGRSGLDERNITVRLRAMAAAGLVVRDGDSFRACEELAMVLSDEMPIDFRAVLGLNYELLGAPVHAVVGAMASGSGLAPATWAAIAPYVVRVNTPTWRMVLVDEFIAADPALVDRLRSGGAIADLACGNGDAARLMADAFPKARVDGYDPSAPEADGDYRARLSRSTELSVDTYDLVTCLDSMHHLGDPAGAASAAHGSLRPGGTFLVAEEDRTGDPAVDDQDP